YLTNDISIGLRTPVIEAEKMKIKYGCANTFMIPQNETIDVPSVGGREARRVSRQILGEIIQPRMEEILTMAQKEIVKSGYEDLLAAGVVLTGGASIMDGSLELGERIFNMPVRRGFPMGIGGLTDIVNSPLYATGVGLVNYGSKSFAQKATRRKEGGPGSFIIKKAKRWFSEFF
ncbi:MAG: cell division FtsA domain-containing protein, partial [Syntrophales bacterium]